MRPSRKVLAGSGSTFMTTLASGAIVTVPHSGPCAHARTWSLATSSGRWTTTLTSRDSTAVSAPMNCQYSSAVSLQRLAAPLATYFTVNAPVVSVSSKLSWTRTVAP